MPIRRSQLLVLLVASACLGGVPLPSASAQEGGIEVFAGETLFDKGMRVSTSYLFKRNRLYDGSSHVGGGEEQVLDEHRLVAGFDFGALYNLTFSVLVPYVYRDLRVGSGPDADADGLGDIAILAKYRLIRENWKKGAFNLALVAGLEIPTGRYDLEEDGQRLPRSLQPGGGSWNPFLALTVTSSVDRWRFDGRLFYKLNTEGPRDFDAGDFFSAELDVAYRILQTKYPGPTGSVKIGLQYRFTDRSQQDGDGLDNTGREELFLKPGFGFHPVPQMDLSVTVDLPIHRHVRGRQLAREWGVSFAVGWRF